MLCCISSCNNIAKDKLILCVEHNEIFIELYLEAYIDAGGIDKKFLDDSLWRAFCMDMGHDDKSPKAAGRYDPF